MRTVSSLSKSLSDPSQKFSQPRIHRQHHITVDSAQSVLADNNDSRMHLVGTGELRQRDEGRRHTIRRMYSDDSPRLQNRAGWLGRYRKHPSAVVPTKPLPQTSPKHTAASAAEDGGATLTHRNSADSYSQHFRGQVYDNGDNRSEWSHDSDEDIPYERHNRGRGSSGSASESGGHDSDQLRPSHSQQRAPQPPESRAVWAFSTDREGKTHNIREGRESDEGLSGCRRAEGSGLSGGVKVLSRRGSRGGGGEVPLPQSRPPSLQQHRDWAFGRGGNRHEHSDEYRTKTSAGHPERRWMGGIERRGEGLSADRGQSNGINVGSVADTEEDSDREDSRNETMCLGDSSHNEDSTCSGDGTSSVIVEVGGCCIDEDPCPPFSEFDDSGNADYDMKVSSPGIDAQYFGDTHGGGYEPDGGNRFGRNRGDEGGGGTWGQVKHAKGNSSTSLDASARRRSKGNGAAGGSLSSQAAQQVDLRSIRINC